MLTNVMFRTVVSSAYKIVVAEIENGRSFIHIRNNNGPSISYPISYAV